MTKLLNGIHVAVMSVLALYAGRETIGLLLKLLAPPSQNVRYWKPGAATVIMPLSLAVLLIILGYSTRILRRVSLRALGTSSAVWLVCLTWFGWFTLDAPFRLHELVDVNLNDPAAISRSGSSHLIKAFATYLFIVAASLVPIAFRWHESHSEKGNR